MKIRTDNHELDTDKFCKVERMPNLDLLIALDDNNVLLTGDEAKQAWAQITEQAEIIREDKEVVEYLPASFCRRMKTEAAIESMVNDFKAKWEQGNKSPEKEQ